LLGFDTESGRVVALISDLFGWVSLVIDYPGIAGMLFAVGAILALYSLLDWPSAGDKRLVRVAVQELKPQLVPSLFQAHDRSSA
jgi:uncharacterized membrane protein YtjA (UPF0391 family)